MGVEDVTHFLAKQPEWYMRIGKTEKGLNQILPLSQKIALAAMASHILISHHRELGSEPHYYYGLDFNSNLLF